MAAAVAGKSELQLRVTVLHLDGEDLTLSQFLGGLLVRQLHMT